MREHQAAVTQRASLEISDDTGGREGARGCLFERSNDERSNTQENNTEEQEKSSAHTYVCHSACTSSSSLALTS